MFQIIISWFGRIIAAFLRLFPSLYPKQETLVTNFYTPEQLRELISNRDFQLQVIAWQNAVLRPLESDEEYLKVCKDRPEGTPEITTETHRLVYERMEPFMLLGTPAHGLGHHVFDFLTVAAWMSNDEFIAKLYPNEREAAFFSAVHDGATGIQHRYIDDLWECNHGDIFGYIAYYVLEGILSEPVRRLLAYLITAHPHLTKDKPAKNGGYQVVWKDEIFYDGDIPVRYGVSITRGTDRLSNGGDAANHWERHTVAALDAAKVQGGTDLHYVLGQYSMRGQLPYLFTPSVSVIEAPLLDGDGSPVLKDGVPVIQKTPTLLKHLDGYAKSAQAFPYSPYNRYDHLSENMKALMDWKVTNSSELIRLVTETSGTPNFELFVQLMKMNEGYPLTQQTIETINMVRELWDTTPAEDQARWALAIEFAWESYFEWIDLLQRYIAASTDPIVIAFQPLVPDLVKKVTG